MVLDDRALASHLFSMMSQGTLQTLSRTCRRWSSDTFVLAPHASRALAQLTTWPAFLSGECCTEEQQRRRQEKVRLRLLERIRLACQDSDAESGMLASMSASYVQVGSDGEQGGEARAPVGGPGDCHDWFQRKAFRDTHTTDRELALALDRAVPGDVPRLILCTSRCTDAGLAAALAPHWHTLTDLCVSSCGVREGGVTGSSLAPLACEGSTAPRATPLRSLTLIGLPRAPVARIVEACNLRAISIQGVLPECSIESFSRCHDLEVLRLSLSPRVGPGAFVRVFTRCSTLRLIDVYHATDISDQLLGCVMLHVRQLEEFHASHRGGRLGSSHILSARMTRAFREHYAGARISIDNLVGESVL